MTVLTSIAHWNLPQQCCKPILDIGFVILNSLLSPWPTSLKTLHKGWRPERLSVDYLLTKISFYRHLIIGGFNIKQYYGKTTKLRDSDFTNNYLSYWTDNGERRLNANSWENRKWICVVHSVIYLGTTVKSVKCSGLHFNVCKLRVKSALMQDQSA